MKPSRLFKNRCALGTPVANLIIMMSAVILSITVTFFAMNVTTSQVQKESIYISQTHLWYVNSTYSTGAIAITNTGPTDIVLNKVIIKGLTCTWNGTTNYVIYSKSNETLKGDLPFTASFTNNANTTITIGNVPYNFDVAQEGLTLKSGQTMVFYIALPERLMVYDLGTPVRIVISTTQAAYCSETLVQTT
jgi:hypothetical protein